MSLDDIKGLKSGDALNNKELCEVFGCSPQGGMRRARATNTLVLISNHVASIYDDRWIEDVFHYTGMGSEGDQSLEFMQNRTLNESKNNGVNVHLFEVFREQEYIYTGEVILAGDVYKEEQPDVKNNLRTVYVFPLRLKDNSAVVIDSNTVILNYDLKIKKAKRLSDAELSKRANTANRSNGSRKIVSTQYDRNPWVSENAKRLANGICQLCDQPAPFINSNGEPYLETHHIIWLAKGGEDSPQNTVALCPNCHRKMHVIDDKKDVKKLQATALNASHK
jgi:5-methylcytosine-specific restriction protein A